jgi:hypothetical protein
MLNPALGILSVCRAGDVAKCQLHETLAVDFVPLGRSVGSGTDIVLLDKLGHPSQCTLLGADSKLECASTSAHIISESVDSQDVAMQSAILLTFPHGKASTRCGSSDKFAMKCSSVREVYESNDKFVTGSFSGPAAQELLTFKGGGLELCDLTTTPFLCRKLSGVPSKMKLGRVAAAKIMTDKRHALVAVDDVSITTCTVEAALANGVKLFCSERETTTSLKMARFFVVPSQRAAGAEKIQFIPRFLPKQKSQALAVENGNTSITAIEDPLFNIGKEIAAQANGYLASPLINNDSEAHRIAISSKVYNPDTGLDDFDTFPFFSQFRNDEGDMFEVWSDSWNRYSWDWDSQLPQTPREKCLQDCDNALSTDTTTCGIIAGAVAGAGLSITVGATVGALITGPGAVAVAGTGLAVTADATAVSAGLCMGWAYYQRFRCGRRC